MVTEGLLTSVKRIVDVYLADVSASYFTLLHYSNILIIYIAPSPTTLTTHPHHPSTVKFGQKYAKIGLVFAVFFTL